MNSSGPFVDSQTVSSISFEVSIFWFVLKLSFNSSVLKLVVFLVVVVFPQPVNTDATIVAAKTHDKIFFFIFLLPF